MCRLLFLRYHTLELELDRNNMLIISLNQLSVEKHYIFVLNGPSKSMSNQMLSVQVLMRHFFRNHQLHLVLQHLTEISQPNVNINMKTASSFRIWASPITV